MKASHDDISDHMDESATLGKIALHMQQFKSHSASLRAIFLFSCNFFPDCTLIHAINTRKNYGGLTLVSGQVSTNTHIRLLQTVSAYQCNTN